MEYKRVCGYEKVMYGGHGTCMQLRDILFPATGIALKATAYLTPYVRTSGLKLHATHIQ